MSRTIDGPVHPRWDCVDLDAVAAAVAAAVGLPVRRVHAWSNLVFDDGDRVHRVGTDDFSASLCVNVARHVAAAGVPTLPAPDPAVTELAAAGRTWYLSHWPRVEITRVEPDTLPYDRLGKLLAALHSVPVPADLPRWDPLRWTRARLSSVQDRTTRARLTRETGLLTNRVSHASESEPTVLLHGDVHLDNLGFHEGELVLFDFESASVGPRVGDLWPSAGWVKRTGRPSPEQLARMLSAYEANAVRVDTHRWTGLLDAVAELSTCTWELTHGR